MSSSIGQSQKLPLKEQDVWQLWLDDQWRQIKEKYRVKRDDNANRDVQCRREEHGDTEERTVGNSMDAAVVATVPIDGADEDDDDHSYLKFNLKKEPLARLRQMFRVLRRKQIQQFFHAFQRPYSFYLPGLPAHPFHTNKQGNYFLKAASQPGNYRDTIVTATQMLEASYPTIKQEMLSTICEFAETNGAYEEYTGDGGAGGDSEASMRMVDAGMWKVFYFYHNFERQDENCARCPATAKLVDSLPGCLRGMVCFSAIDPGTHILPHTGPSNMRLTCHLGMVGCKGALVTVEKERQHYRDGKCVVFDDSFVHEVTHHGLARRVTLMLDFWHPHLLEEERAGFMQVVTNLRMEGLDPETFFHSLNVYNIIDGDDGADEDDGVVEEMEPQVLEEKVMSTTGNESREHTNGADRGRDAATDDTAADACRLA